MNGDDNEHFVTIGSHDGNCAPEDERRRRKRRGSQSDDYVASSQSESSDSDSEFELAKRPKSKKKATKRVHRCARCGFSSARKLLVDRHRREPCECAEPPRAGRALRCPSCPYASRDGSIFARHAMIHAGEKPYRCEICGKIFTELTILKKHRLQHAPSESYFLCGICPCKCVALV